MNKENLKIIRILAISLSIMLGSLTLCNLLTIMTHGIVLDIPDEKEYTWAIDPVDAKLILMSQFSIQNKGAYDIDDIDIRATVVTDTGKELLEFRDENLAVSRGSSKSFDLLVEISPDTIQLENWFSLLYRDTTLSLVVDIDAEYMFGLIHVTVDEVLDYGWQAPLSQYTSQVDVIPWMLSVMDDYYWKLDQAIWDAQHAAIEYLMDIDEMNFSDAGYEMNIVGSDALDGLRNLDCSVVIPVPDLSGSLEIDYSMDIGFIDQEAVVNVKEVRIGYVSQ